MSLVLSFENLQFAKPHRYFLLVKSNDTAKRTKISEITESPIFDSIFIQMGNIEISACLVLDYSQKGLEGKTLIVGTCTITQEEYQKQISIDHAIQLRKNIVQSKGGKQLTVGTLKLKITSDKSVKSEDDEYFSDIDDFQLKEDEVPSNMVNFSNKGRRVKVNVLFGSHFTVNQQFKIEIGYSESYSNISLKRSQTTNLALPSINPFWNHLTSFSLQGLNAGFLVFIIKNSNQVTIDKASFPLDKFQPFHQYHLEIISKQFTQSVQPHIFVQIQLQALPKAFTEEVCELNFNRIHLQPEPKPHRKFILAFSQQKLQSITFQKMKLDKDKSMEAITVQRINKQYQMKYFTSPIIITPISDKLNFEYFFLKSIFVRKKLVCTLFQFDCKSNKIGLTSKLSANSTCINELKSCFYNQKSQMFSLQWQQLGKNIQCVLQVSPLKINLHSKQQKTFERVQKNHDLKQNWRDLSNQLMFKQKLIHQMRSDIDNKIHNIQSKGKRIEVLRKVQKGLMDRKKLLAYKQSKQRSIQIAESYPDDKIDIKKLKRELINACEQVLTVQNVNQQMRLRLQSLNLQLQQKNIKSLQNRAVNNSRILQEQQQKIKHIQRLQELLKYQGKTLLRLQKQFEKGIIDHQMNQLLNKELKKVEMEKKKMQFSSSMTADEYQLQKILGLLQKNQKKEPQGHIGHLKQQIRQAQQQLRRKTQVYAKMINR